MACCILHIHTTAAAIQCNSTHIPDAQRTHADELLQRAKGIFILVHYTLVLTICIVIFQQNNRRCRNETQNESERENENEQSKLFLVRAGDTTETLNLREYRIHAIWCFVGVTHATKTQRRLLSLTLRICARFVFYSENVSSLRTKCTFSSGNSKIHSSHTFYTHRVSLFVINQLAREREEMG